MRIIREKTAAVCVDYQERILPVMTDPETLLQNTVKLLKGLRVLGVPVYLTQHIRASGQAHLQRLSPAA